MRHGQHSGRQLSQLVGADGKEDLQVDGGMRIKGSRVHRTRCMALCRAAGQCTMSWPVAFRFGLLRSTAQQAAAQHSAATCSAGTAGRSTAQRTSLLSGRSASQSCATTGAQPGCPKFWYRNKIRRLASADTCVGRRTSKGSGSRVADVPRNIGLHSRRACQPPACRVVNSTASLV